MKKYEEKRLNVFRSFFQTVPVLLAFGIIIVFERYDLYFPYLDLSFGCIGSFAIAIFICFATQVFVNTNPMLKNTKSGIVAGAVLTIEIMLLLLFAQYHFFVTAIIVAATVFVSLLITKNIIGVNKERRVMTKKLKLWCKNRSNSLVAYILCFVLIVPAGIGVYEEYCRNSLSSESWATFLEDFNENNKGGTGETTGAIPHEDKIENLLKWETLSVAEKERVIRSVALIEKEELGISENVEITVFTEKMSEYTRAYYTNSSKEIFINYKYLNEGKVEDVLQTVLHEMHHAFVYYTVDNLDYESELVRDNYYYKQAREWKENTENYLSSNADYDEYKNQPIEVAARTYAEERVKVYMSYINGDTQT